MNTKLLLESISDNCLSQLTKYKYNRGLNISNKYRKGKITSLTYILDSQKDTISNLKDGDYKSGLIEVLRV